MDTGRAGTIGGISSDSIFKKSFFAKQGYLPKKKIFEYVHDDIPAPDFTNLNGGSIARVGNRVKVTCSGTPMNFGWDMGAAYTKVLMVSLLGRQANGQTQIGFFISHTQPSGNEITDGFLFATTPFTGGCAVAKFVAGAFSSAPIDEAHIVTTAQGDAGTHSTGTALYVDAAGVQMAWVLMGGYWMPLSAPAAATSPADFRYVGYRPNLVTQPYAQLGQFGVWAE